MKLVKILYHKFRSYKFQKGDNSVQVLLDEAEDILGKNSVICAEDFTVYTVPLKS